MAMQQSILARSAPYVCAAVLCSLVVLGGISARRPFGTTEYRARVRAAIEAIPYRIGPAVGTDSEPTEAAVKILSPNKILERHYVDPATGASFSLLIVHCGDVRDMVGHYPPVCYPAHGWQSGGSAPVDIEVGGEKAFAIKYSFSRTDDLFEHRMAVVDFFVIPEENAFLFSDMNAVEHASRSSEVGGLGVAQIQIVMGDDTTPQRREQIIRETLRAIAPAIKVIAQGIKK
jgi:hypothetical protein